MISKKGQATTFVILGIVMLSTVITFVYFKTEILDAIGKKTLIEEPTTEQIKNLKQYTQSCMKDSIETGISLLGLQGGYISQPLDKFPPAPYNMLSNSLDLFGDGGLTVPYWSYLSPNGIEKTQVPSKNEMEKELEEFAIQETLTCINDYTQFRMEGYQVTNTNPVFKIKINDETVNVDVLMNLDVEYKQVSQSFTKFKFDINSNLGNNYRRALELFEHESNSAFIENFTLELMAVYDEIPYSGVDFECTPRTWLKSRVIQDLKSIMELNIPTIKIEGTDYKLRNKNDALLVEDALKKSARDTSINFLFSRNWPIMIDIIGENSEILMGDPFTSENEAAKFLLPLFCLNDYHFVYDIKFPVLISLTEGDNTFQFAVMGVIDNNQPKTNKVSVPQFEGESEICSRADTKIKIVASELLSSGSKVPLKEVDISYQCTFTNCDMGKTRLEGAGYSLTTLFPQCMGGQLTASKQGYHSQTETVDTNGEGIFAISLEPYNYLPVQILVKSDSGLRTPYDTEKILFQFENSERGYATSYYYPSNEPLKLLPGNYKVSSTLMVDTVQGFTFDEREMEICSEVPKRGMGGMLGMTERNCVKQTMPEMKLDSVVAGGSSFEWFADGRGLATSNKITIYTTRGKTPTTLEEMNKAFSTKESEQNIMRPTFE